MAAVGEAKIVISADDRTGDAFKSLERKVKGLGATTKAVGEAAGSVGKIAGEVDRVSGAVARSTEAVNRFSGVLKTVDGAATSIGKVAASVDKAANTMPRLTADAGNMARALANVTAAEKALASETDRVAKAGSKLTLFKALQGDLKGARATMAQAQGELASFTRAIEERDARIDRFRAQWHTAVEAQNAASRAVTDAPTKSDAADDALFKAKMEARKRSLDAYNESALARKAAERALADEAGSGRGQKLQRLQADAAKASDLARSAYDMQRGAVKTLKGEIEQLAGPMLSVSSVERRLTTDAEAATRAFEQQSRAATAVGEATVRAIAREEEARARQQQLTARWARDYAALERRAVGQAAALAPRARMSAVEALAVARRRPAVEGHDSALARQASELAQARMNLNAFREVQATTAELRRAAREAQADAVRVGRDVKAARDPSPELLADHARVGEAASSATAAFERQAGVLKGLKAEIESVIGPMHSLASAEAQLAQRTNAADGMLKRQQARHKRLHAAREVAEDILPFEGPEVLHLTKEAFNEGAALQHERVGLQNAGRTPEQIEQIERRSREVSAGIPTATSEENLKIVAETTPAFGSLEHALDHLEFMQKTMSVLKTAGGEHIHGSAGDVGRDFAKFFEERLTKPEEFESEAKQMIPAMVASGGTFNPREMYMFAQQAKSALPNYDMHFLSRVAPSLITAMGGERAGTAANAFNSIIMGKVNDKKQAEAWLKAGLLDKDKVIMKAGHAVGWSAGAVKNTDLALRDPLAWAEQVQNPALAGTGVDMEDRLAVAKALGTMYRNQNGNMFATEMTQSASRSRLHKDEGLYDQVGDLDTIRNRNLHEDPTVALGAIGNAIKTFAGDVTSPIMKDVANVLGHVSEGLASLGKGIADFDAAHPELAKAIAGGAIGAIGGTGLVLTGMLYTNLKSLLSGAGQTAAAAEMVTAGGLQVEAGNLMLAAAGKNGLPGGGGLGSNAIKEAEKDAAKLAPAAPLLAGAAVPTIVAGTILAGGAAAGAMKAPIVDEYGRVTGNFGGDPEHPFGFQAGNAMLRHRKAHNPRGIASRLWNWATGESSAPASVPKSILPEMPAPIDAPLPPVRSADLPHIATAVTRSVPAVLPFPVAALPAPRALPPVVPIPEGAPPRGSLPPASAVAPVPVHVVSMAVPSAALPTRLLPPGLHPDFTLGNRTGDFSSPGLGAGSGFSPFPGHHAPSVEAVQAHATSLDLAPHIDLSGLDTAVSKAGEAKGALAELSAMVVNPQVSFAQLDALIAKANAAKAALAGIGGAATGGTMGSVGPSRVVADPGVGRSR